MKSSHGQIGRAGLVSPSCVDMCGIAALCYKGQMPSRKHLVAASARMAAPPARVYAIIADYREAHPRILPKEFTSLIVEQGGVGAGTVFLCEMKVFGQKRIFRAAVTEPEPGRVLVETDLDGQVVTTFTVNSCPGSLGSDVTITTELMVRSGVLGAIECFLITRSLHGIYIRELALLAACAGEDLTTRHD